MKIWDFESIENYIKENYENINLLKLEVKRINNRNKKYITITNGIREREMQLTNFLKRGCDFHEKTDKRINIEDICEKIKSIYEVEFEFKCLEFTDNTFNTYFTIMYKKFTIKQHYQSFIQSDRIAQLEYILNKEKFVMDRYNLTIIDYNKDKKRWKLSNGKIEKWISDKCVYNGEFTIIPMEDKKDLEILEFMKQKYKSCEVLNISRKPTNSKSNKNYIYVRFLKNGLEYEIEYGRLKKGFNFYSNSSLGENIMTNILKKHNVDFIREKTFEDLKYIKSLRFDFYIPLYNSVIEIMGQGHYEPIETFGGEEGYKSTIIRDKIKLDYAINNNIKYYYIDRGYEFSANRIKIFINDCYEILSKITGEDYNERKIHIC